MRLQNLERGHRRGVRFFLRLLRLVSRKEPPDVVKTLYYRPEFYGAAYSTLLQDIMRGPSEWAVGERELFAAFVSRLNQCPF
ncbi:MAG: hypothetical protein E6G40_08185 [Actinobacteria bacterium]|nr:MAG: hypothetical protein E6G40_08185 [Actinomycetota bacterium]